MKPFVIPNSKHLWIVSSTMLVTCTIATLYLLQDQMNYNPTVSSSKSHAEVREPWTVNPEHDLLKNLNLKCPQKNELYKPGAAISDKYDQTTLKRHPNLPELLVTSKRLSKSIPDLPSIRWAGTSFQESWNYSPKFLVYSAHVDARIEENPSIRIIALYDGDKDPGTKYYCQIWLNKTATPYMVSVSDIKFANEIATSKHLNPYLISCDLPQDFWRPDMTLMVSLVKQPCQTPSNILEVTGSCFLKPLKSKPKKKLSVGVCGKALFYYNDDFSTRLIEWIEIMRVLDVAKIFLYTTAVHENVQKVLDYYEDQGFVKLISFQYPPPYVTENTFVRLWTKTKKEEYRAAQKMYLNDCLLRNKDDFDYLMHIDSDEVPILKDHQTLTEFLEYIIERYPDKTERGSILLNWKLFYGDLSPGKSVADIPELFYILRHNQRTKLNSKYIPIFETNTKSIHDTQQALWVFVHTPYLYLSTNTKPLKINPDLAYIAHFGDKYCKSTCEKAREGFVEETALLKYKTRIMKEVNSTLKDLHL